MRTFQHVSQRVPRRSDWLCVRYQRTRWKMRRFRLWVRLAVSRGTSKMTSGAFPWNAPFRMTCMPQTSLSQARVEITAQRTLSAPTNMLQSTVLSSDTEDTVLQCPASPYLTSDKSTYAYTAFTRGWPTLVVRFPAFLTSSDWNPPQTSIIDDVHRTVNECNSPEHGSKEKEGKNILHALASLKYELSHNKQISAIRDNATADLVGLNGHMEHSESLRWLDIPYIVAECYLYR